MTYFRSFGAYLLIFVLVGLEAEGHKACEGKERALVLLEFAENSLSKAKGFHATTSAESATNVNQADCKIKEKSLAYMEITQELISEAKKTFPNCTKCCDRPVDCSEVTANGETKSGVYTVWPKSRSTAGKSLDVYCDMTTDGGGWTVIQRRGNFTQPENFNQDWETYKNGFGNVTQDFWLGNDIIHALSNQGDYEVRFDIQAVNGQRTYAVYDTFWIDDEKSDFVLHIKNYSGDAGDCMKFHDGCKFSTKDKSTNHWAELNKSGWWHHNDFAHCNLNGLYKPGQNDIKSVTWFLWLKHISLASVEIKIRAK